MAPPDPRPPKRVKDSALMKRLHQRWRECCLCGTTGPHLSLHHVHRHPRDDVEANLVMVCGSGTTGCHGRIEARDRVVGALLRDWLLLERPDTLEYLRGKLGAFAAREYLGSL